MSENIFSFFKQNVGEEDVIKLLLLSAGKALATVAILLSAVLSYFKLCEWYGSWFVTFTIVLFTLYLCYTSLYVFGDALGNHHKFNGFLYKTWKYALEGLAPFNKMIYLDFNELNGKMPIIFVYLMSWIMAIILMVITFVVGLIIIYVYAFIISLRISIEIPPESLLVDITLVLSVIIMSILFLKLKWKKIWLEFNLNLAAWCICAAFVITTISFVAGVAIRRIAGFIGIEYTAILVSAYVIITAIYVYLDLKQWLANKEYMARIEANRNQAQSEANPLKSNP